MNEPKKIDLVERRTAVLRVSVRELLTSYIALEAAAGRALPAHALRAPSCDEVEADYVGTDLVLDEVIEFSWPTAYSTIAPSHPLEGERQSPDLPVELRD